ncbi:MAG: ABC transporter ATP-binding protein [Spirochaetales bacterium]
MNAIISVHNLRKRYKNVQAVDGVSFEIPEGICFGLLGPNGAGKTTAIEMMEGISQPDSGEILFRGAPIGSHFKEKVGIQFQSTALPEFITVRETLKLFAAFYPTAREIDEVIDICSLTDIIDRDNRKLSGGQRQRLLLALAIVHRPEIVFLDEPTTGLDPQARRNFWQLIRRIRSERTTVILTTHYMDEAEILCDQIAIMDQGKILEIDAPEVLLNRHFSGSVIHVPDPGEEILGNPERLPSGAMLHDGVVELTSDRLDDSVRSLLAANLNLDGLTVHRPNLEDLFIKLTGSSLRA